MPIDVKIAGCRHILTGLELSLKLCTHIPFFYFAIIPTRLIFLMCPNYPGAEFVATTLKFRPRMEDLLSFAPVRHNDDDDDDDDDDDNDTHISECITQMQSHWFAHLKKCIGS